MAANASCAPLCSSVHSPPGNPQSDPALIAPANFRTVKWNTALASVLFLQLQGRSFHSFPVSSHGSRPLHGLPPFRFLRQSQRHPRSRTRRPRQTVPSLPGGSVKTSCAWLPAAARSPFAPLLKREAALPVPVGLNHADPAQPQPASGQPSLDRSLPPPVPWYSVKDLLASLRHSRRPSVSIHGYFRLPAHFPRPQFGLILVQDRDDLYPCSLAAGRGPAALPVQRLETPPIPGQRPMPIKAA